MFNNEIISMKAFTFFIVFLYPVQFDFSQVILTADTFSQPTLIKLEVLLGEYKVLSEI